MNKFEYFEKLKQILLNNSIAVEDYTQINYGLQFYVIHEAKKHLIRIYESKKGTRLDLSQVKDSYFANFLENSFTKKQETKKETSSSPNSTSAHQNSKNYKNCNLPSELIGTDESGKGDYFGPLVIAGVYTDKQTVVHLEKLGVMDSKQLSDNKITRLAKSIRSICKYSIVPIGNKRYNELYDEIKNLNRLLAWGHARCIENILDMVDAEYALADQFGDKSFIENALLEKGKTIILKQEPKAEKHLAVAAASILARDEFLKRLETLSKVYQISFPKGASNRVVEAGKKLIENKGKSVLCEVAKLHFKTTLKL